MLRLWTFGHSPHLQFAYQWQKAIQRWCNGLRWWPFSYSRRETWPGSGHRLYCQLMQSVWIQLNAHSLNALGMVSYRIILIANNIIFDNLISVAVLHACILFWQAFAMSYTLNCLFIFANLIYYHCSMGFYGDRLVGGLHMLIITTLFVRCRSWWQWNPVAVAITRRLSYPFGDDLYFIHQTACRTGTDWSRWTNNIKRNVAAMTTSFPFNMIYEIRVICSDCRLRLHFVLLIQALKSVQLHLVLRTK